MASSSKLQRTQNLTGEEKILLKDLIISHKEVIEDKKLDGNSAKKKKLAWETTAKEFNACYPGTPNRTVEQLKSWWKQQKVRVRKEATYYKIEKRKTGGGPPPPLPDLDQSVLDIIAKEIQPLSNEFDDDVWHDVMEEAAANNSVGGSDCINTVTEHLQYDLSNINCTTMIEDCVNVTIGNDASNKLTASSLPSKLLKPLYYSTKYCNKEKAIKDITGKKIRQMDEIHEMKMKILHQKYKNMCEKHMITMKILEKKLHGNDK